MAEITGMFFGKKSEKNKKKKAIILEAV